MSPTREAAFGLALVACMLGALLSQIVLVSTRRSGVYRIRFPGCDLVASRNYKAFFLALQSWVTRVHLFTGGAAVIAVGWVIVTVVGQ